MLYLSQMLGEPVIDANGEKIGSISDLAILRKGRYVKVRKSKPHSN